jgi:hypothetical protein
MGKVGKFIGHHLGGMIGHHAGKRLGKYTGIHAERGKKIGETLGAIAGEHLVPFKKGGKIKKNGKIYAHKGEFILPKGVSPTTHQLKVVKKRGGHL